MAIKKVKGRSVKKKSASRRRVRRASRFDTQAIKNTDNATFRVRIFDRKVKKFIRGEWELSHALAVFAHLLDNPENAKKFGYVD